MLVYPSGGDVSTSTLRYLSACLRTRRRAAGTQRPDALYADRGYDHDKYRKQVREAGIKPVIARRGEQHDSGLGVYRWVVEQGFALLHWFRRLRIRWEIRDDIHEAFLRSPAPSSPRNGHGIDVNEQGDGTVTEPRLYQLIRQRGDVRDRTFEIAFLEPGGEVYVFTFGKVERWPTNS